MKKIRSGYWSSALFIAGIILGAWLVADIGSGTDSESGRQKQSGPGAALAQGADEKKPVISPVKARPRETYYPNSEDLDPDEIRVIA